MTMMSERHRAFHALEGRTFPRVGARGRYFHTAISLRDESLNSSAVVVVAVTKSGKTLTVRFADKRARTGLRAGEFRVYRRGDGPDGSGWYLPPSRDAWLRGEVLFAPDAKATLSWRLK